MTISEAGISELQVAVEIDAAPEAVWTSLTSGIGDWWPDEFYAGGSAGARRFTLDARPGGAMTEEWNEGGGVCWGSVVAVEPDTRLQVIGYGFPNWGGPSQWFGTWELAARGDGTTVTFSEHAIGRVSEGYVDEKEKGWQFLLEALKARLEGREPPVWSD